ncbi:hypothetical protein ACOHYD_02215 [Desulfobacterota bacterium M19]
MGTNELFDGIARVVEQFAEEITEQKLRDKEKQIGRGRKWKLRIQRKNT